MVPSLCSPSTSEPHHRVAKQLFVIHTQLASTTSLLSFSYTRCARARGRTAGQTTGRGRLQLVRRPLCSWRPAGSRRDDSHMFASLQLRELRESRQETADHKTCLRGSGWPCGCWRCCCCLVVAACTLMPAPCCLLLAACCHSHCWTKQASAGICSRGRGPAAARGDHPGCMERWEFRKDRFRLSGEFRESGRDCSMV